MKNKSDVMEAITKCQKVGVENSPRKMPAILTTMSAYWNRKITATEFVEVSEFLESCRDSEGLVIYGVYLAEMIRKKRQTVVVSDEELSQADDFVETVPKSVSLQRFMSFCVGRRMSFSDSCERNALDMYLRVSGEEHHFADDEEREAIQKAMKEIGQ